MKFDTDRRLIQFRISNELVLKLIASGLLSDEFSKQDLNDVVKSLIDGAAETKPLDISPTETKPLLDTLQSLDRRLALLEGKSQPQVA